jgi:hypothetical protein
MSEQGASANGGPQHCPECRQKYWIQRESFMLRAYRKQGRIYCFDCGQELGSDNLCRGCGTLCPDYCVVQSSKAVVRKQPSVGSGYSFSTARKSTPAAQRVTPKPAAQDITSRKGHKRSTNVNWLAYAALAVMLLILAGGMTKVYLGQKADQKYAKDFITTLYGIKSGTDLSLGAINTLISEWTQAEGASTVVPRPNQKDLDKMAAVKIKISAAISTLNETPEKFAAARTHLISLHKIYDEIYALNTSAPGSLAALTESMRKLETKFFKTAEVLKNSMPEELLEELQLSVAKYRNLNFMVDKS